MNGISAVLILSHNSDLDQISYEMKKSTLFWQGISISFRGLGLSCNKAHLTKLV